MAKLIVELSEETHKALKKKVMLRQQTIKGVVTNLVEGYLIHEGEKEEIKKTGLCGAWADTRTADEIITDLKRNRHWLIRENRRCA